MTEDQSLQELSADIQKLIEADTDDFFELGKLIGLDPLKDLAGADLHGTNLRGADLSRANLSKTNLREANLSGADLSEANLSGAALSNANLTDADLSGAKVNNTHFKDNPGINSDMKRDLEARGAIFKDPSPPDNSPLGVVVLEQDVVFWGFVVLCLVFLFGWSEVWRRWGWSVGPSPCVVSTLLVTLGVGIGIVWVVIEELLNEEK